MITKTNVTKHEFIGHEIEVVGATNADLVGLRGTVVDETKNLFVINTNSGDKKVLKKDILFRMKVEDEICILQVHHYSSCSFFCFDKKHLIE